MCETEVIDCGFGPMFGFKEEKNCAGVDPFGVKASCEFIGKIHKILHVI